MSQSRLKLSYLIIILEARLQSGRDVWCLAGNLIGLLSGGHACQKDTKLACRQPITYLMQAIVDCGSAFAWLYI